MTDWGICSGSQIRAQAKYDSKNTTRVSMKLNFRTDKDVIQWLWKQKSMQGAIKQLIRDEINRTQSKDKL